MEKYKEQLMVILEYVSRIEEEIKKLKSKVEEEETKLDSSALMVVTECCTEKEKKKVGENGKQQEVGTEGADNQSQTNTAAEENAAKIQRLKNGFRICKPQGTFLWPNMVSNNNNKNSNTNTSMLSSSQVVVQVEDLLVVQIFQLKLVGTKRKMQRARKIFIEKLRVHCKESGEESSEMESGVCTEVPHIT